MSLFIMLMTCNTFDYSPLNLYLVILWILDYKYIYITIIIIFEYVIFYQLFDYMCTNNLLTIEQFGFRTFYRIGCHTID